MFSADSDLINPFFQPIGQISDIKWLRDGAMAWNSEDRCDVTRRWYFLLWICSIVVCYGSMGRAAGKYLVEFSLTYAEFVCLFQTCFHT